jgi:drug/metabolite transporter (DMT)-like permease
VAFYKIVGASNARPIIHKIGEIQMDVIAFVLGLVLAQSGFVAIVMYQAEHVMTSLLEITKYTLLVTPVLVVVNIIVNLATNLGNKIFNNLAFVSIANTMTGVIMALIISAVVFKQPLSIKAIIGCVFIVIGVILTGLK